VNSDFAGDDDVIWRAVPRVIMFGRKRKLHDNWTRAALLKVSNELVEMANDLKIHAAVSRQLGASCSVCDDADMRDRVVRAAAYTLIAEAILNQASGRGDLFQLAGGLYPPLDPHDPQRIEPFFDRVRHVLFK
jgi:hypothetical protein